MWTSTYNDVLAQVSDQFVQVFPFFRFVFIFAHRFKLVLEALQSRFGAAFLNKQTNKKTISEMNWWILFNHQILLKSSNFLTTMHFIINLILDKTLNLSTFASGHTGKSLSAIEKQYCLILYSEFPLLTLTITSQNWEVNIRISTQKKKKNSFFITSELSMRIKTALA